jgi:uncharacterized protein YfdQ (DUF2303 family)
VKKIAQKMAQPIFGQDKIIRYLNRGKMQTTTVVYFCKLKKKPAKEKKSPNGRNFAQSGHPGHYLSSEGKVDHHYDVANLYMTAILSSRCLPLHGLAKRQFRKKLRISNQGCQMVSIFKPKIQIWVNFGGPWNVCT